MKRILIVEDNEFNLDLLVQLLEDEYALLTKTPRMKTGNRVNIVICFIFLSPFLIV